MTTGIMMTFDLEALRERHKQREQLIADGGFAHNFLYAGLVDAVNDTATLLAEVDRLLILASDFADALMQSVEGDDDPL